MDLCRSDCLLSFLFTQPVKTARKTCVTKNTTPWSPVQDRTQRRELRQARGQREMDLEAGLEVGSSIGGWVCEEEHPRCRAPWSSLGEERATGALGTFREEPREGDAGRGMRGGRRGGVPAVHP